jgi:hypothetical protein
VEQSGDAAESDQPRSDADARRGLLIAAVLALVVLVGALAWSARPDDGLAVVERQEERFPPAPTLAPPPSTAPAGTPPIDTGVVASTATPTTVAVVETLAPTVAPTPPPTPAATPPPAPPAPPTTNAVVVPPAPPPTNGEPTDPDDPSPAPEDPAYVAQLVPNLAAFDQLLATPELAQAQIDELLVTGRHDVAAPGPVLTICAAVRLDRPLATRGRWERDGRRIASSALERRDEPGFGECLADDGEPLDVGSYQYVATDSNGNESAAGGIVIGAARLDQRFRNDVADPICTVRIAPSASRYFEVYVFTAAPVSPGAEITLPVADVEQDVEAIGCDGDELAAFSFEPDADVVRPLAR